MFLFDIKSSSSGKTQTWTLDLKNHPGGLYVGPPSATSPDITIQMSDSDFVDMAVGKLSG